MDQQEVWSRKTNVCHEKILVGNLVVDLDLKKQIFWLNQLKNKDNIPLLSTCSMVLNFEKKNY